MVDRAISGNYAQHSLKNGEIHRYSRQLLIPEIGVDGSLLCWSSVAISSKYARV